ncbi:alpha,alpha-trehalose-phosphate synthase (UDP-forming) [Bartonella sp. DGB2]|uniref:alpha,alpha-trehalose-phosphate synthase (UDP-forming) n=1 Tax=Bartonella sp. DGB2 TaxID=3388426 RepID=UPI00398FFCBA
MSRLIMVSNRVPLPDAQGNPPAGGLAVALSAALQQHQGIWMGWSGMVSEHGHKVPLRSHQDGAIQYALFDLSQRDIDEYYAGFANRMLWPLCHYRIDLVDYARQDMRGYFRVNRLFAEKLAPLIKPGDKIWVHDYHLIPLASELRQRGIDNPIGFFLHIPWPPADIFFTLPVHEIILRGLAAYDLVGFQTDYDVENFTHCLIREGVGKQQEGGQFFAYNHLFRAAAFPISIDTDNFAKMARKAVHYPSLMRLKNSLLERDLIVGVDRLDYSKGILHRLDAYERFLGRYKTSCERVSFLQITPKSRSDVPEYAQMQQKVASIAGRINGDYGNIDWTPIRYVNRSFSQEVLGGLYRVARVGLVTPLRDGMNLVAKEYIAAQDPENPGVLILSRFAGAARELTNALLVNPYDGDGVSHALAQALSMALPERQERWQAMMQQLRDHTITHWCTQFLQNLQKSEEDYKIPSDF